FELYLATVCDDKRGLCVGNDAQFPEQRSRQDGVGGSRIDEDFDRLKPLALAVPDVDTDPERPDVAVIPACRSFGKWLLWPALVLLTERIVDRLVGRHLAAALHPRSRSSTSTAPGRRPARSASPDAAAAPRSRAAGRARLRAGRAPPTLAHLHRSGRQLRHGYSSFRPT